MSHRKIVITGYVGFMGSHLADRLSREKNLLVPRFEDAFFAEDGKLDEMLKGADTIVHLAAMNRGDDDEIYRTNINLVNKLTSSLERLGEKPHVIFSSSTQASLDNTYGKSKIEGEKLLHGWSDRTKAPVTALVIPNVFGDRGKPFYNSVVATFCHLLTHGGKPEVKIDKEVPLIYISELCEVLLGCIQNPPPGFRRYEIPATSRVRVTEILAMLEHFRECLYEKKLVPYLADTFQRNLYNVFLAYAEASDFQQPLTLRTDDRGSLFEIVKQERGSQTFFSTTKPGIIRGNHYHTRKMEKFCVVKGEAIIRLRRIGTDKALEYRVSGEAPSIVEMPIFYTHHIENVGDGELCTLFWTSEVFDPNDADTYFEKV
jgi:UDP-2-acetamido-2,6-beta-L-arabino-hexul-4-ose reductase